MNDDIRWKQSLANFRKAFGRLDEAVLLSRKRALSDLERQGLIQDGETWMEMIEKRNLSRHTYDLELATELAEGIRRTYCPVLRDLQETLGKER